MGGIPHIGSGAEYVYFRCGKRENRPAVLEPTSEPKKKKKSSHRPYSFVGKLRGWGGGDVSLVGN